MREIKLRFWLKDKMQGILELKKGGLLDIPWSWDTVDQFTGFFDKKGNLIFEGDIVKRSMKTKCCNKVAFESISEIVWKCNGFYSLEEDGGIIGFANIKNEIIEIIGNKYSGKWRIN